MAGLFRIVTLCTEISINKLIRIKRTQNVGIPKNAKSDQ